MPCDTVTTMEVATAKFQKEYFLETLKKLGMDYNLQGDVVYFGYYKESYNFKTGELQVQEGTVNSFKRAYSATIVEKQFGKLGWKPQANTNKLKGEQFKYVYTKR